MDAYAHGSYLSAKAWNSRVLLEWLNEAALRAATNDLPIGDTRLHKNMSKNRFFSELFVELFARILSLSLSLSIEDRTLGKWLQNEVQAGRRDWPTDPLLTMNPLASFLATPFDTR